MVIDKPMERDILVMTFSIVIETVMYVYAVAVRASYFIVEGKL